MNHFTRFLINRVKLMRPKHWLKNVLIFIPIVFSKQLLEIGTLIRAVGGFFAFSFIASAVYILNDIQDVESDRRHEVKKNRPIASGEVGICGAYVLAAVLVVAALLLNYAVSQEGKAFFLLVTYFVINIAYSFGLKHIPFVDISLLVLGFLIRVLYGAAVIDGSVSHWVSLTVIALSFYLSLGKRRNELLKSNGQTATRRVLKFYSVGFLDKFMYLCLSIAIVFYALWSADEANIVKFQTDKLIWTVPLVILLMMKYSADVESDSSGGG